MKILVISDIHETKNKVKRLVAKYKPDCLFFAGDGLSIFEEETAQFDQTKVFAIKGNCDMFSTRPTIMVFTLGEVKFLLTHGHNFNVKTNLAHLYEYAKKEEADCVIFGHTHEGYNQRINDIKFFNPGALGSERAVQNSFGIIEIEDKKISAKIEIF